MDRRDPAQPRPESSALDPVAPKSRLENTITLSVAGFQQMTDLLEHPPERTAAPRELMGWRSTDAPA